MMSTEEIIISAIKTKTGVSETSDQIMITVRQFVYLKQCKKITKDHVWLPKINYKNNYCIYILVLL